MSTVKFCAGPAVNDVNWSAIGDRAMRHQRWCPPLAYKKVALWHASSQWSPSHHHHCTYLHPTMTVCSPADDLELRKVQLQLEISIVEANLAIYKLIKAGKKMKKGSNVEQALAPEDMVLSTSLLHQ